MARRILVVDDDAQTVHDICRHLEAVGFEVVTASSGHIALSRIVLEAPRSPIHGVLLDSRVAGSPGTAVIREIKGWNPGIWIIVMACVKDSPEVFKAFMDGADDLIPKPVDPDLLSQRCLSKFLSRNG